MSACTRPPPRRHAGGDGAVAGATTDLMWRKGEERPTSAAGVSQPLSAGQRNLEDHRVERAEQVVLTRRTSRVADLRWEGVAARGRRLVQPVTGTSDQLQPSVLTER